MPRLYLIRHGKAAAGWGGDPDPGLDAIGRAQATQMVEDMAAYGPLPILVSPLKRTRETAAPLEARWNLHAHVDEAVAEVPSPTADLAARVAWLHRVMAGTWGEAEAWLRHWRQEVLDRLTGLQADTVVVSHFVAINVAVGAAGGDERVVAFRPDNCSISILDLQDGRLSVVQLGREAQTEVG